MYSKSTIEKVRLNGDIRNHIPGLSGRGVTQYAECPECHAKGKGKGLCVTHKGKTDIAKCFKCGFTLNGAINAEMFFSNCTFPEAVEKVAQASGIYIEAEEEIKKKSSDETKKKNKGSFCEAQLAASGLTFGDVTAHIKQRVNGELVDMYEPTFKRGGFDAAFNVNYSDDEMLIFYYKLDGTQETYPARGAAGAQRPYIRVRWSNPSLHRDKDDREIKYQTPKGAPTKFYFPQRIRDAYLNQEHIETLIVQEGEKKAEKACKHGIPSIGIQGIFNIGNKETGLIQDLQYLIQTCTIKNVVIMLDADWDHLSRNLQIGDAVDQRPNQFSAAVIKFKKYLGTLHNIGVNANIYFGHINDNDHHDKGIDDLLCNTLKGREDVLAQEIDRVIHTHDGKGVFCDIHNITTISDLQIKDFWLLNDKDAFFEKYKERILGLERFKFAHFSYKVENGQILQKSKLYADQEIWEVKTTKNDEIKINLDTYKALRFLNEAGYYILETDDVRTNQIRFIHIEDNIVSDTTERQIRKFLWSYILQTTKDETIRKHFATSLAKEMSIDKLERLDSIEDIFDRRDAYSQNLYFANGVLNITPEGIQKIDTIPSPVWEKSVTKRKIKRIPIFANVNYDRDNDLFTYKLTEEGAKCEYLQFIIFASNFWWRKTDNGEEMTYDELKEWYRHIFNKLTAIGFLIHDYKFLTEMRAVVSMDGEMSEVGQSQGRTGKSLIGEAIKIVKNTAYVSGRNIKNDDDFLFTTVNNDTKVLFFDDVNVNFDFEKLYTAITGDMQVNVKNGARFTIPKEKSPKIYVATNHAFNSYTRSSSERIIYMSFSDFFSEKIVPYKYFGHQLFSEWDDEQWNLFYNLMAECCHIYLKSLTSDWAAPGRGAIAPPMKDIRQRTLKQQMSETLYQWAETYYDVSGPNLNQRQVRKDVFEDFKNQFPEAKRSITPSNFRTKIVCYCEFKGYHLNPNKVNKEGKSFSNWIQTAKDDESFIGIADKAGGLEYFTVCDTNYAKNQPW